MNHTVSTKLTIPQLAASLMPRHRLMQQLDQGLRCQLTLVSAPAGYGKTTSVAMWARSLQSRSATPLAAPLQAEVAVAWYALDAEDNAYSTFFTRLSAAIETAMPGALPTVATGLAIEGIAPRQYANALSQACLQLPRETVLVLDDYHVITVSEIHMVLAHLIQFASTRLHLVIVSRHNPQLPISRLRGQQQVVEVRVDELRLTEAETTALLTGRLAEQPPARFISRLQERTEGWFVGLQLAARAMLEQENLDAFIHHFERNDDRYVLDFLFDEVLNHVPAEVRAFLLTTGLLARFNVEMAATATGLDIAICRQIIEQLGQQNLFLVVLDHEGTWYRYHHQFRAMLVNRAGSLLTPGKISAIRRDVVDWLVSLGWIEEALAECVADRQWEKAADLVEADRHRLQNRQEWHLLWRRVTQLPDEVVAQRPGLLLARAWILQVYGRYSVTLQLVEQAAALLASETPRVLITPPQVLWGEVSALRGAWFYLEVPLEQRLALLQNALTLLTPVHEYGWGRGFAYISLAHVMLGLGQGEVAHKQIAQEIERVDLGRGEYLARLRHAQTTLLYLSGPLSELEQAGSRYLQVAMRKQLPMAIAWARFAIGWSLYQQGRVLPALDVLLPIFDRPQDVHLQNLTLALAPVVAIAAEIGQADVALRLIDLVRQIGAERENSILLDEVAALSAYAALLSGDRQAARHWAAALVRVYTGAESPQANLAYSTSAQIYICAKIMLAAGSSTQLEQVKALLQDCVDNARHRGYAIDELQATVLLACCCWRTNRAVRALDWMQQAVRLGMQRGYRRVFFELGADVAEILYAMAQRNLCADDASRLLAEVGAWHNASQGADRARVQMPEGAVKVLTDRETEILALLAERLSNKEIARRLNISALTVRNHANSIYSKLNVTSRKQAVAQANALHLLPRA